MSLPFFRMVFFESWVSVKHRPIAVLNRTWFMVAPELWRSRAVKKKETPKAFGDVREHIRSLERKCRQEE